MELTSTPVALILLALLICFCGTLAIERIYWPFPREEELKFKDPAVCRMILAGGRIGESGRQNKLTPVESRAIPNRRLVDVFGVDNAFTTSETNHRATFSASAREKLTAVKDENWVSVAEIASKLIRRTIQKEDDTKMGILLVPFVQTLTLSISLHVLFGFSDPLEFEEEHVSEAASIINELWLKSKHSYDKKTIQKMRSGLQAALQKSSPEHFDFDFSPQKTPLNLVLPAYETMWRVVLHCFLEVSFRHSNSAANWRAALQSYLHDPSDENFKEATAEAEVSVKHVVYEALRLYPPTRRVYRTFSFRYLPWFKTVAAGIEQCQRDRDIWGDDSTIFKPSRWNALNFGAWKAFMPFGGAPFTCPAKETTFGPKMIGLLVAALVCPISSDDWMIRTTEFHGSGIEGEDGADPEESRADRGDYDFQWSHGPLLSRRDVYEYLEMLRKPPRTEEQEHIGVEEQEPPCIAEQTPTQSEDQELAGRADQAPVEVEEREPTRVEEEEERL